MSKSVKAGQVFETYQGRFAKVLKIENGMYAMSAFHNKEAAAEADDVIVKRVNSFGLSQIVKNGKNAPKAETAPEKKPEAGDGDEKGEKPLSKMNKGELEAKAEELALDKSGTADELRTRIKEKTEAKTDDK